MTTKNRRTILKQRKARDEYAKLIKELPKQVNIRAPEVLFSLFLRAYPLMRLNESDDYQEWTNRILTFFAELGKLFGFEIYLKPNIGVLDSRSQKTNEYLVDMCWDFEDEQNRANWIELALESELSGQSVESITYDFHKLADLKACVKVGIFGPKLKDKQEVLDEIVTIVSTHGIRIPNERYLVILLIYHGKTEIESKRIEISGYELNYLGDIRELVSTRFPEQLRKTRTGSKV